MMRLVVIVLAFFCCGLVTSRPYPSSENEWTLSYTPIKCFNDPFSNSDAPVFGSGFDASLDVSCVFQFPKAPSQSTLAIVVSPTELYCPLPEFDFTGCSGQPGEKLVEFGRLTIALTENQLEPISNALQFTAMNTLCVNGQREPVAMINGTEIVHFGENKFLTYVFYPKPQQILSACKAGNQYPIRCPDSTDSNGKPVPVFDENCKAPSACMWTFLLDSYYHGVLCPVASSGKCFTQTSGNTAPCLEFVAEV